MRAVAMALVLAGCSFDPGGGSGAGPVDGAPGTPDAGAGHQPDGGPPSFDAHPLPSCDSPWVSEATGCHQYIKDTTATFDGAEQDCEARGGHLAVEDKQDEYQTVAAGMAPLGGVDRFWIGLHDPPPDDNVFVWVTGLVLVDTHWAASEPSNTGDCVNARPDGTWGDRNCGELKWYACEKND